MFIKYLYFHSIYKSREFDVSMSKYNYICLIYINTFHLEQTASVRLT